MGKKKKKAAKAAGKKAPAKSGASTGGTATATLELHGAVLTVGDVKKGGTASKPVAAVVDRKCIKIVKGFNPRMSLGDFEWLTSSIKKEGILQSLLVRPTKGKPGSFDLVAGERRLRAADAAGRTEIPVLIRTDLTGDDDRARAVSIAENSDDVRSSLNAIEIGVVVHDLSKKGWSVQQIAKESALHAQKVRRCLSLMEAPKEVQGQVSSGELSMIAGLELAKLDEKTRKSIKDDLEEGISAAKIKQLAKAAAKKGGATPTPGKTAKHQKGANRAAALTAWKGASEKQKQVAELCYYLTNAEDEEVGTGDYHELRGAVGYALWDRGDLDNPILPGLEPDEPDDKKALKKFVSLTKAEAKKYTPPADDSDGEE